MTRKKETKKQIIAKRDDLFRQRIIKDVENLSKQMRKAKEDEQMRMNELKFIRLKQSELKGAMSALKTVLDNMEGK